MNMMKNINNTNIDNMTNEVKGWDFILHAMIRQCCELSAQEKLLYLEIAALTCYKGYCWAMNQYFADIFHLNKETVSRQISKLAKGGFIRVEFIYAKNSNQIAGRRIYLEALNKQMFGMKYSTPPCEEDQYPLVKNVKDNNIINNNINTISLKSSLSHSQEDTDKDESKKSNFSTLWENPDLTYQTVMQNLGNHENTKELDTKQTTAINTITATEAFVTPDLQNVSEVKIEVKKESEVSKVLKTYSLKNSKRVYKAENTVTRDLIHEKYGYETLVATQPSRKAMYDSIIAILSDVLNSCKRTIRCNSENMSADKVKERMLELTSEHIAFVVGEIETVKKIIFNKKAYIITSLYNSLETLEVHKKNLANQQKAFHSQVEKNSNSKNKFHNFPQRERTEEYYAALEKHLLNRESEGIPKTAPVTNPTPVTVPVTTPVIAPTPATTNRTTVNNNNSKNKFHNFPQRERTEEYYAALERHLLNRDSEPIPRTAPIANPTPVTTPVIAPTPATTTNQNTADKNNMNRNVGNKSHTVTQAEKTLEKHLVEKNLELTATPPQPTEKQKELNQLLGRFAF